MIQNFSVVNFKKLNNPGYNFDPRLKFILFLLLGVIVFILNTITSLVGLLLFLVLAVVVSQISFWIFIKTLKPVLFIFFITWLFYYYFGASPTTDSNYWALYITTIVSLRIYNILLIGTILIITTSELELARAITWLIHPLKWVKVPVDEIAMIITLGLRFVPIVMLDMKTILKAQETRGLSYRFGSFKQRCNAFFSAFLPLFVSSFRRADDLSKSMIARGYIVGQARTCYQEKQFNWFSILYFLIALVLISSILFIQYGEYSWLEFGN
ncbi:MAG: hypothetical protein GQ557_01285 [Mycoplasmataceae bacterium]|nr:hypothetical protein [Mycoplasmataceae bacterium]